MKEESDENSSVFIYYAGHGFYPEDEKIGYWIPKDGGSKATLTNAINTSTILGKIEATKAKHILLMADSCFSGELIDKFRGGGLPPNSVTIDSQYFKKFHGKTSRQIITSGGVEPVIDHYRNGHSIFAYQLLRILETPSEHPISASALASQLITQVVNTGIKQTPEYGRMRTRNSEDDGGEFFLIPNPPQLEVPEPEVPKTNLTDMEISSNNNRLWHTLTISSTVLSLGLTYNELQSRNQKVDDNIQIKEELRTTSSQQKYNELTEDVSDNDKAIRQHEQNILYFGAFTVASLIWEIYLFTNSDQKAKAHTVNFDIAPNRKLQVAYTWSW